MKKIPLNRLPRGGGNYSAIKARALRNAYPFMLTQKEYASMVVECHYGHGSIMDGYRMYLDTINAEDGFIVGNAIFCCERHLGGFNTKFACSNERDLMIK